MTTRISVASRAALAGTLIWFALPAMAQLNPGNPLGDLPKLKQFTTQRSSSSDPDWRNGNADARPIAPGATLEIASLKGPGTISHIWFTIAARERGYSRLLVLRMFWDDEKTPSVECPVGDFFGIGHGLDVPYDSLPFRVTSDGRGRNCYWPMPFRKSARITVTNEGREPIDAFYYYVDWLQGTRVGRDTAYFHAQYRQEFPAVSGRNYVMAELQGNGHVVGTVLSCRQRTASWWGEGDDFWTIDGEKEPRLRGTGTEDYYCDGWGFRKQAGCFYGAPLMEGDRPGCRTSVYRWHIPDPVVFHKSLRLEIEHKGVTFNADGSVKSGFEERADDLSSVVYWYQTEPHAPFPPLPAGYARLYYDYSKAVTGVSLLGGATATEGAIEKQDLGESIAGAHLWWRPSKDGQELKVPFHMDADGVYDLLVVLTRSWDYGRYQVLLDGAPQGDPIDLFSAATGSLERLLPSVRLSAGSHVLGLRGVGKNAESAGYLAGIQGLLPVKR